MVMAPDALMLRRCALAVSVLENVDVEPRDDGLRLPGTPELTVSWSECRRALAGVDAESDEGRHRLARWLKLRRWVATLPLPDLAERARPYAVAVDSPVHPGLDWVRMRVLGDQIDVGFGFVGLDPDDPDRVEVVPQGVLDAAGVVADDWWPAAVVYLEQMGRMALDRHLRDSTAPLRPMGDCDVLTLLASRTLRAGLAERAQGMCPVAVPMRTRGWTDLTRIDPAFARVAAAATEPRQRGFERPVLLTAEEVAATPDGPRPAEIVLRDPAVERPWVHGLLYHH